MTQVFIALGSNIAPEHNLLEAVHLLATHCRVLAVSPVYETAPVGTLNQPNFLNAAALIETDLPAADLKTQVLQPIEQVLGRIRTADKNAPRTIDLDIALYGEAVFDLGSRHIPDPDITRHAHVAIPLADLAPNLRHPETGQTLGDIAATLPGAAMRLRLDIALSPSCSRADKIPA